MIISKDFLKHFFQKLEPNNNVKNMANAFFSSLQNIQSKNLVSILTSVILVIGVFSSLALMNITQDIRQQAQMDGYTQTSCIEKEPNCSVGFVWNEDFCECIEKKDTKEIQPIISPHTNENDNCITDQTTCELVSNQATLFRCNANNEKIAIEICSSGQCDAQESACLPLSPTKDLGESCQQSEECITGSCINGVCIDQSSNNLCSGIYSPGTRVCLDRRGYLTCQSNGNFDNQYTECPSNKRCFIDACVCDEGEDCNEDAQSIVEDTRPTTLVTVDKIADTTQRTISSNVLNTAEEIMENCSPGNGGRYNNCAHENFVSSNCTNYDCQFWCTELVMQAYNSSGYFIETDYSAHGLTSTFDDRNASFDVNQIDRIEQGQMISFTRENATYGDGTHIVHVALINEIDVTNGFGTIEVIQGNGHDVYHTYNVIDGVVQCDVIEGWQYCPYSIGDIELYQENSPNDES